MDLLRSFVDVQIPDVFDIALVAVFVYLFLAGLRRIRIRRVARVLIALAIIFAMAEIMGMRLTVFLLRVSVAAVGLALAIIYHDEIRAGLEHLVERLARPQRKRNVNGNPAPSVSWIAPLVVAVFDMAKRRIGALVVVCGNDEITRHTSGGVPVQGLISESLLMSIFDPNSIGHDGAVVVNHDRITTFQTHLPLSTDHEKLKNRGTRHAAALGMSERTDALCVVVSEERGVVSVARDGQLRQVDEPAKLERELSEFVHTTRGVPVAASGRFWEWKQLRPKLAAIVIAYVLWFVLAHEASLEYRSYTMPVQFTGLAPGLEVTRTDPPLVKVILSGPRRAFYFVGRRNVEIQAALFETGVGELEVTLTASDVIRPDALNVANVFPRTINVAIGETEP